MNKDRLQRMKWYITKLRNIEQRIDTPQELLMDKTNKRKYWRSLSILMERQEREHQDYLAFLFQQGLRQTLTIK